MASRRSFGVFVASSAMLVLTVTGGIAGAAPVGAANKCVAGAPALAHSTAPASQRYAEFKQAQLERMDDASNAGSGCKAVTKVASKVIRRPSAYAAFKDLQAGN